MSLRSWSTKPAQKRMVQQALHSLVLMIQFLTYYFTWELHSLSVDVSITTLLDIAPNNTAFANWYAASFRCYCSVVLLFRNPIGSIKYYFEAKVKNSYPQVFVDTEY